MVINRTIYSRVALAVVLSAAAPGLGTAQTVQVRLTEHAALQSTDEGTYLRSESRITLGASGVWYVAPTYDEGTVAVFSPDGSFLRAIGRLGQGPGELRRAYGHAFLPTGRAGELYVWDSFNDRFSVFDGEGAFRRSFPLPVTASSGSELVVSPSIRPDGSGNVMIGVSGLQPSTRTYQLLSITEAGELQEQIPLEARRLFQPTSDGAVLLVPTGLDRRPVIHLATRDGRLRDSIALSIPEDLDGAVEVVAVLGVPQVLDLMEDGEAGLVWVLAQFERANMPPLLPPIQPGMPTHSAASAARAQEIMRISEDIALLNERRIHVIYVFEKGSKEPLVTQSFEDLYLVQFVAPGRVVAFEGDDVGRITARIFGLSVER